LKHDDAALFDKAMMKLEKNRLELPHYTYTNVVDCELTLVADLARRKGWTCDRLSIKLQDQVFDRSIFD
jgi:hypothetical protein